MWKVKKKIHRNVNKNQADEITKIQKELKISIKNLYINDQKKKKTIGKYAQLTIEQMPQPRKKHYSKPIRKRKHYFGLEPETESDLYVEVRRRPKQQQKKESSL